MESLSYKIIYGRGLFDYLRMLSVQLEALKLKGLTFKLSSQLFFKL